MYAGGAFRDRQNLLNQCDERLGIRKLVEVEVLSYGHLPPVYSVRCFTARSEDRPKDECETRCIKYPNGRNVLSQETNKCLYSTAFRP